MREPSDAWSPPVESLRGTGAPADLTQHEIQALKTRYNLADAHTHQHQSDRQKAIVNRLPALWYEAENRQQSYFEDRFVDAFFRLHRQPAVAALGRTMLSYSASVATTVAAMYLKDGGKTVSLIEPCFDNLTDLLRNMQVKLAALPESVLSEPDLIYDLLRQTVHTDALFLVDPNNPTGSSLAVHGLRAFAEVVRFCVDHGKILVIDFCFAAFALCDEAIGRPEVYRLLEESGVSYLAIEDTGKTWPIQDAKCALLTVSRNLYPQIYNLHTSMLLNVSPFVLNLVTAYIEDSIGDGLASVRDLLARNRAVARTALDGSGLTYQEPAVETSVAWFRIESAQQSATVLQRELVRHEIYVLPGTYFFWDSTALGERFIRLALARDPVLFAEGMWRTRAALDRRPAV
jgi:aspartate/methionine/tyrosine aminotransferase